MEIQKLEKNKQQLEGDSDIDELLKKDLLDEINRENKKN